MIQTEPEAPAREKNTPHQRFRLLLYFFPLNTMSEQTLLEFSEECGWQDPLSLTILRKHDAARVCRVLQQPFALIGRAPQADVSLPRKDISWRHAYLQVIEGRLFCVDLKSRIGIRWPDGQKSSGWVSSNDTIQIGPFIIQANGAKPANGEEDDDLNPLAADAMDCDDTIQVSLEFLNSVINGSGNRTWDVNRRLTFIGQNSACRIRFSDSSVSTFHCSLVRTPRGLWAIDLLGYDGILINEEPRQCALLEDGDCLKVGKFKIRIHYHDRTHRPRPSGVVLTAKKSGESGLILAEDEGQRETRALESTPAPPSSSTELVSLLTSFGAGFPVPMQEPPALALPESATGEGRQLDPMLMTMFHQFTSMQQRMFDQFQQTIWMIVQTFSALHKDQVSVIREELDRLHELNQELHTLQATLAKQAPANQEGTASSVLSAAASGAAGLQAAVGKDSLPTNAAHNPPQEEPLQAKQRTAAPQSGKHSNKKKEKKQKSAAPKAETAQQNGSSPTDQEASAEEVHNWIFNRMAQLEKERQNSWQKILGYLMGK